MEAPAVLKEIRECLDQSSDQALADSLRSLELRCQSRIKALQSSVHQRILNGGAELTTNDLNDNNGWLRFRARLDRQRSLHKHAHEHHQKVQACREELAQWERQLRHWKSAQEREQRRAERERFQREVLRTLGVAGRAVSVLEEDLGGADRVLDGLLAAVEAWHELRRALQELQTLSDREPTVLANGDAHATLDRRLTSAKIVQALEQKLHQWKATLISRLVDKLNQVFVVVAHPTSASTAVPEYAVKLAEGYTRNQLCQLCLALQQLEALQHWLEQWAKRLEKSILLPLVSAPLTVPLRVVRESVTQVLVQPASETKPLRLGENEQELEQRLEVLAKVLQFPHSCFQENRELLDMFVNVAQTLLFPTLCSSIIQYLLSPAIPVLHEDLGMVQERLSNALAPLLAALKSYEWPKEEWQNPLPLFVDDYLELHFVGYRSDHYFTEARDILMKNDFTTVLWMEEEGISQWEEASSSTTTAHPLESGLARTEFDQEVFGEWWEELHSAPFSFPTCRISAKAKQLYNLVQMAMQEAQALEHEKTTQRMLQSLLDMLDLYRILIPAFHQQHRLERVVQQEMILYNDYMFLSHRQLLLGSQFSLGAPDVEKNRPWRDMSAAFLTNAFTFRRLAHQTLRRTLSQQRQEMLEGLRSTTVHQGLRRIQQRDRQEQTHHALKQCERQLQHLFKQWKPLLPPHLLLLCAGWLLGGICEELVDYLEAVGDLEEVDCELLFGIFLGPLSEGGTSGSGNGSGGPDEGTPSSGFLRRIRELMHREVQVIYAIRLRRSGLNQPRAVSPEKGGSGLLSTEELTDTYLPRSYHVLVALMETLNMTLVTIVERFRGGYYHDAGLKMPRQLMRLVTCIFSDTHRRQDALQEMERDERMEVEMKL